MMDLTTFWSTATGFAPYDYQAGLAKDGLPEILHVPTGCGKTAASILPWLYRRRFHPEATVRAATPRRLVIALPMRVLVDQYAREAVDWLAKLNLLDEVNLTVLMGGLGKEATRSWHLTPTADTIVIGSVDMLLSRALNRGYAENRWWWPIDFGWLNADTQWVFDEVQLLGPALPTSRQLQALRERLGTLAPTSSMWMSATVDDRRLRTVDAPTASAPVQVTEHDRSGALAKVLDAQKTIRRIATDAPDDRTLAEACLQHHRRGTRTLVFCNTVKRARNLAGAIRKKAQGKDDAPDIALLHSRMRPLDRAAATARILDADLTGQGQLVVTTQALEAGVDISSATLITEVCPWSSIVQRAGRCNRRGELDDATLWWIPGPSDPKKAAPYDIADLAASAEALDALEGESVTGEQLVAKDVEELPPVTLHLRERDVWQLFDTTTDLSGGDIDVSPFIRVSEDRDVYIAWRPLNGKPGRNDEPATREEICSVPLGEARDWIKKRNVLAHERDAVTGTWTRVTGGRLRPNLVLLVASSSGGYSPDLGWDPDSRIAVPAPASPSTRENEQGKVDDLVEAASDEGIGEDRLSFTGSWVALDVHLRDAENEARQLVAATASDASDPRLESCVWAARFHDLGKAHDAFQTMLRMSASDDETAPETLLAKSSRRRRARNDRPYFRHELVSALMLMDPACSLLDGAPDRDLVLYLVAAHHGRVRLSIRSHPAERQRDDCVRILGVDDGELIPEMAVLGETIGSTNLNLTSAAALGGSGSWSAMATRLLHRHDLGPFRLATLEAIVRLADFAASRTPSSVLDGGARA